MGGHGKYHHHPAGGMGASTGASQAGSASGSSSSSSAASNSGAAAAGTLPTTGAPIAGLLGLAVAVLAAGLVARRLTRRDAESQPEEA
jgi:hypothetical protein